MKLCLLNDCTNFNGIAPCCRECPDPCPDSCRKSETTFCVGVIEDYNDKNTSRTIKE